MWRCWRSSVRALWRDGSKSATRIALLPLRTATISKSGDTVKMWDLLDYRKIREVEGVRYLSQKSESEYDCKKARTRPLVMFLHLGMMGSGQTVFTSTTPDPWQRVEPGSVNEALMKYACAQR